MDIRIAWFSGTGSTAHVARVLERECRARGHRTEFLEIRRNCLVPREKPDLLILCYPVHASNAPSPVIRWLKDLKRTEDVPAAILSVSGGGEITPNRACRLRVGRLLRRRGRRVFYEKMIIMPSNWRIGTSPALTRRLLQILPEKIAFVAEEILRGKRRRSIPGLGNRLLSLLGRLEVYGARRFGEGIGVRESCTGCGLCARGCPSGNISMGSGKPEFARACVMCMGCLYRCPAGALYPTRSVRSVIPEGYDFKKMVEESLSPAEEGDFDLKIATRGYLWLGVRRYLRRREDCAPPASGTAPGPSTASPSGSAQSSRD